mgnify:CR=1 FL=1
MIRRLRGWARAVKRDLAVLWLAARDPRVPVLAKALAVLALAYALSPVDLIPDVIPVLGQVDDLIVVPLLIWAALRCVPPPLLAQLRVQALARDGERLPASRAGAVVVVVIWVLAAGLLLAILTG